MRSSSWTRPARYLIADDYPIGAPPELIDRFVKFVQRAWGTDTWARVLFPSVADDADLVSRWARMTRAAATPRTAAAQFRYILQNIDVRSALPLVQVPTLVLGSVPNTFVPVEHAHFLADHIHGAKLIELPSGGNASIAGEQLRHVVDEVVEFITGVRPHVAHDRVLATVLFTDIAGSTERLSTMGDRTWRSVLDTHDRTVRAQLRRYGGREINTTGDGFVAAFDGPARAIRCAQDIVEAATRVGVDVRAGLHSGECERRGDDLSGIAVHIAARVGTLAAPGEVLVSSTVKDLVAGSDIRFDDRGVQSLKGIPDDWRLFAVQRT